MNNKRAESAKTSTHERRYRRAYCDLRLHVNADPMSLTKEFIGALGGDFARVHEMLHSTLYPTMLELGTAVQTDKIVWHGYHRFYEKHFSKLRSRPQLKLLEIGLARGSSMNLWCGYFPTANIYGVDITLHSSCMPCRLADGIFVFSGDTTNSPFMKNLTNVLGSQSMDIIVDDGAHTPESQLSAFNHLFHFALKPGGVYIIEDIETSYWTRGELYGYSYSGGGRDPENPGSNVVNIFKNLADSINR